MTRDLRLRNMMVREPEDADLVLWGIPYDGAVVGRKGCRDGPAVIREAFRWFGGDDGAGGQLDAKIFDAGDCVVPDAEVLHVHDAVTAGARAQFMHGKPVCILGGDNSLSFATMQALVDAKKLDPRDIGLVVIDAHYDMRDYEGQPTSGTPFRRCIEELKPTGLPGQNIIEIGIRPFANAASLSDYAHQNGVKIVLRDEVRQMGGEELARTTMSALQDCKVIWYSIDIDAFDQSIAAGCSAPSPDGLLLHELLPLTRALASDPRCAGLEIMETAPNFDPTGNTARTAAQLVVSFLDGLTR